MMNKILLVLWILTGIVVLAGKDISKISYFCCWMVLLMKYVEGIMEE